MKQRIRTVQMEAVQIKISLLKIWHRTVITILLSAITSVLLFTQLLIVTRSTHAQAATVTITEFMAANRTTIADEDGDFSDWIEIHNAGSSAINLLGYTLSDESETLEKWRFPSILLNPDQYLIVYASAKNRVIANSELHTNFRLRAGGEYLAFADPAGSIVSEFSPTYPATGEDVAYGVDQDGQVGLLASPSPGMPNGYVGLGSLSVSPASQPFENSIEVELNSQVIDAIIRYTIDGSTPTAASLPYGGPISVTSRTTIKAQAFFPNGETSPVETHHYVRIQGNAANATSNLPLIVIDTFGEPVDQENQTPVFAHFIDVDSTGQAAILDAPQLSTYGGFKIRGALSTQWDKKQYALETWDENQVELDVSPLGLPPESDWILNGPYADKTLMKNVLAYDWWNQMGRYASRTRFVEVYLNTDDAVTESDYIGLYVLLERIKRDDNRVEIEKLLPTDNSPSTVDGGYIWKVDGLSSTDFGFISSQGTPNCLKYFNVYPRYESATPEQQSAMQGFVNQYDEALFGDNFVDPNEGYAKYIDVDSFIDYGLMQDFTQNTDGYHRSVFFHKPRDGKVTMGPIWDFNFSLGVDNRGLGDPNQPVSDRVGGSCWQDTYPRLFSDPEFEVKYWDRWYELRETVFDKDKLMAEIDANAAMLDEAQMRNFERWDVLNVDIRDVTLPGTYTGAIAILKDWVSDRIEWFDGLWVGPPIFNQEGGAAAAGFQLIMSKPQNIGGTIYYTLDGRDPREVGGEMAADVLQYNGPLTLNRTTRVMARVKINTGWSALNDDIFNISPAATAGNLSITEIQYNPHQPTATEQAAGLLESDSFEFIELQNSSNALIDISQVQLTGAVTYDFVDSNYLTLQPDERVLVVKDRSALEVRHGLPLAISGEYRGRLSNSGEAITLLDRQGSVIETVLYADGNGWPKRADGRGSSLTRNDTNIDGNLADNWRSSIRYGGTPGAAAEAAKDIMINEILAHSDPPLTDSIELFNRAGTAIDISYWYISDSGDNYKKFQFPAGTALAAGGFLELTESDFNNAAVNNLAVNNLADTNNLVPFALSSSQGEDLYLLEADSSGDIIRFADQIEFGATATDMSIGRWPDGADHFYPMRARTLGRSNINGGNGVGVGTLVISEIHYNPASGDTNLEYIEIYNRGTSDQALDNWLLRGDVEYDFPVGTVLASRESMIVVGFDPADAAVSENFRNRLHDFGNIRMLGPWTTGGQPSKGQREGQREGQSGAQLPNNGGIIKLQKPDEIEIPADGSSPFYPMLEEETVRYSNTTPWPLDPDSSGPALERIDVTKYGDDPLNWQASILNGGTPGVRLQPDILVNAAADPLITTEMGGTATVDIMLQSPPRMAVTIPLGLSDRSEGTISPTFLIFSAANWNQPQRVTITGVDDSLPDGDVAYTLRIRAATSPDYRYDNLDAADVNLININDDVSVPTYTPAPTDTPMPTYTPMPDVMPTSTGIPTLITTPTSTNTSIPTNRLTPIASATPTVSATPTASPTSSATSQPEAIIIADVAFVDNKARITWTVTKARSTLGFKIHRAQTQEYDTAELVSVDLIPPHSDDQQTYLFEDQTLSATGTYYYWIEQVFDAVDDGSPETEIHGPTAPLIILNASGTRSVHLPFIAN